MTPYAKHTIDLEKMHPLRHLPADLPGEGGGGGVRACESS